MARTAFVGLGIMGQSMCANLLSGGHAVTVWNRTREKVAPLVAKGAREAATPREAAAGAEAVFTMLADPQAVSDVAEGEEGILAGMERGAAWVDMSTVSPSSSRLMAALAAEEEVRYLEAPVLGSRKPAAEGTLVILTGGDESLAREMEPLLLRMGSRVIHLGPVGAAAQMKLTVNQMMGIFLAALAEAGETGIRAGLAPERILEVLSASAVACPLLAVKGKDILSERRFDTHFPLKHARKDLRLAVLSGDGQGIPTPVTAAAHQLFSAALERGYGEYDIAAVLRGVTER
jgi:3-hydroxyisobutyrate dehydrogenase-like beta-hydroxyacid dehydrogenase